MNKITCRLITGVALGLLATGFTTAAVAEMRTVNDRVMAVVNDQVITNSDVQQHCKLAIATAGATLTPAQQQLMCKRTLAHMIDTELQRQYAASHNQEPTSDEYKDALTANSANFKDIPPALLPAAHDQLRDELRWQNILKSGVRSRVDVGPAQVDKLISDMAKQRRVNEREIAQILMNVPTPTDEDKVKARMEEVQQKAAAGEDFGQLARTYSDSKEAKDGGRMGWFATGELNPELEGQLDHLKAGEVSGLIRTPLGWHLIKLLNVRESQAFNTQIQHQAAYLVIGHPVVAEAKAEKLQQENLAKVAQGIHSEAQARELLKNKDWPESFDLGWVTTTDLQPDMQQAVTGLAVGKTSQPVQVAGNDLVIYKVGERDQAPKGLEDARKRVFQHLFEQKMDLEARKFMRELRQKAFVDIRP